LSRRRFLTGGLAAASLGLLSGCRLLPSSITGSSTAPRIGYLTLGTLETEQPFLDAFLQSLLALGHREGENILIDRREAEGQTERLPELIVDLLASQIQIRNYTPTPPGRACREVSRCSVNLLA